ncbi:MAG: polysaccharide deacetylase family protein [Clostridiales bacterium]|nr:polysaccharide deacetylase family protein [Clostridiales bacterium]
MLFTLYCLVPSYWARNRSKKIIRTGSPLNKEVALTFDDGPNPEYTPRLLDILKEYQVPASFFCLGRQAALYPDIIKRIAREGHIIGCHSYSHRHAWLMPPFYTMRDIKRTYETITRITGNPPKWYRPPWGHFNAVSIYAAKRLNLNIALWSVEARDWALDTTPEYIYNIVIDKCDKGSIIVLHDNRGTSGAPVKALRALPYIISSLHEKGYKFVTLDRMKEALNA